MLNFISRNLFPKPTTLMPVKKQICTINSKSLYKPVKCDGEGRPIAGMSSPPFMNKFNKVNNFDTIRELVSIGYHTNDYHPICFADNQHNEIQSLKTRVICETPALNEDFVDKFIKDIIKNFKTLFPGIGQLHVTELTHPDAKAIPDLLPHQYTYIHRSNADPSVKSILIKTFIRLNSEGITEDSFLPKSVCRQWCNRKAFLKLENLLYNTPVGLKEKAPRFISGAQAQFICLVGPWMMLFQDKLKLSWGLDNFITFSSGKSNEELGNLCEKHYNHNLHPFEDDIGVFDSSVRPPLLQLESYIFKRCGAPRAVQQLVRMNINTRGVTKSGIRYRVEGTRKSGDPYTSLGNSILNGLMHYFAYKHRYRLSTIQVKHQLKMIVQGDDNVGFSKYKIDWLHSMAQFGFESEAKYRLQLEEIEFCSMRLYHSSGGYIFGPMPGRVIAKFGYFVNPPKDVPLQSLLRGSALGLYKQCHFIPPLKIFLDKVLIYTEGYQAVYSRENFSDWKTHTKEYHNATLRTYNNLWLNYGYTMEFDLILSKTIPISPHHLDIPILNWMMNHDSSGPNAI